MKGDLAFPAPETERQLRGPLGLAATAGSPDFSLVVQPLYNLLKQDQTEPLCWETEHSRANGDPKWPSGIRIMIYPFFLFVHEPKGVTLGVLTQQHSVLPADRTLQPAAGCRGPGPPHSSPSTPQKRQSQASLPQALLPTPQSVTKLSPHTSSLSFALPSRGDTLSPATLLAGESDVNSDKHDRIN